MKAVGFVTQSFTEADTGLQLAAVYVPTTPNPTSGYLEIVPQEGLVSLDWSMDAAMTFIISGGTVSPSRIHYSSNAPGAEETSRRASAEWPEYSSGLSTGV